MVIFKDLVFSWKDVAFCLAHDTPRNAPRLHKRVLTYSVVTTCIPSNAPAASGHSALAAEGVSLRSRVDGVSRPAALYDAAPSRG